MIRTYIETMDDLFDYDGRCNVSESNHLVYFIEEETNEVVLIVPLHNLRSVSYEEDD